ncbi:MAG: CoB--CoM heterodisulfide reductase iron-sulfur subunit B family protein [Dehalococcoidales bacterium]|nr:CoB--CoM heterodisulfide reductase iron-sulfur subunit B family protein [Dehalococcoidales bacterium]
MKQYSYYPGCSSDSSGKGLGLSVRAIAQPLEMELNEIEGWTCCGSTPYGSTDEEESFLINARNLAIAEKTGLDLVTPCSSCYVVLSRANDYIKTHDKFKREVNEALAEIGLEFKGTMRVRLLPEVISHDVMPEGIAQKTKHNLNGLKIASYYGCQMVRPLGFESPENPESLDKIVTALGGQPVNFPMKNRCCGSSLIIPEEDMAVGLVNKIIANAAENGAECITTPCPLCQNNLDAYQGRVNSKFGANYNIPVLFVTQLIGLALGINPASLGFNTNIVSTKNVLDHVLAQGVKSGT